MTRGCGRGDGALVPPREMPFVTGLHDRSKARYQRSTSLRLLTASPRPTRKAAEWWRATHHINQFCGHLTYIPTPRTSKLGKTITDTPYSYRIRLQPSSPSPSPRSEPPLSEWRSLGHWGTPRKSRMLRSTENTKVILQSDGKTGSLDGLYSGYVQQDANVSKVASQTCQGLHSLCHWRRLGVGDGANEVNSKTPAQMRKDDRAAYLATSRGELLNMRPWQQVRPHDS